jgi:hypothetical protein
MAPPPCDPRDWPPPGDWAEAKATLANSTAVLSKSLFLMEVSFVLIRMSLLRRM